MTDLTQLLAALRTANLQKIYEEMNRISENTAKEKLPTFALDFAVSLANENITQQDIDLSLLLDSIMNSEQDALFLNEKEIRLKLWMNFLNDALIGARLIQEGTPTEFLPQALRTKYTESRINPQSFPLDIQNTVTAGIKEYFRPLSVDEIMEPLRSNNFNDLLSIQFALEKLDALEKREASTPHSWFSRTNDKIRSIQEAREQINEKLIQHRDALSSIVEIKREIAELEASIVALNPQISKLQTQIDSHKLRDSRLKNISANEQKRLDTLEKIPTIESLINDLKTKEKKLKPEEFQSTLDSLTSQKVDKELISNNEQAALQSPKDALRIIERGLESIDFSDQKLKLYALEIERTSYSGKCIAARTRLEALIKEIAPDEPAASRIKQLSQMPIDNIEKKIQEINKKIVVQKACNATQSRFGAFKTKLSSLFKEKTPSLQINQDATKSCLSWFSLLSCFKRSNEEKSSNSTFLSIIFKVFQAKKTPKSTSTNDIELQNSNLRSQ